MNVEQINTKIEKHGAIRYDVTGIDVYNKRFKMTYSNVNHAATINLYRGTVWGVNARGKRVKLWEIYS